MRTTRFSETEIVYAAKEQDRLLARPVWSSGNCPF